MYILSADITSHLQLFFDFIYGIFNFLDSLKFSAFGYDFSFLGILLALIVLIVLIKFMRFGVEVGADTTIRYARKENEKDVYQPKHAEGRNDYVPLHGGLRSSRHK